MAGILWSVPVVNVVMVTTVPKTLLQVKAPADQRVKIARWGVTLAGTSAIDLTIRLLYQSTNGTGTAQTIVKRDVGVGETIQTVAGGNYTVEPTAGNVIRHIRAAGGYHEQFAYNEELVLIGGGRVGIEVTAIGTPTLSAYFEGEE
jgi:hypothetical protein